MTIENFKAEIAGAVATYDKFIVCIDKTPEECAQALERLVEKALKAYETRAPGLRHGIALDKQVTVIISQTEGERPMCGIYFNLHSPYQKKQVPAKRE